MKTYLFLFVFLFSFSITFAQNITTTGNMSSPRWFHESQFLYSGKVLVFGGDNGDFINPAVLKTAEIYNPATGTWSSTSSMNTQRTYFASVVLPNGYVLAIGGTLYLGGSNHLDKTSSCEIYNPFNGSWVITDSMSEKRAEHLAILLNTGKVLVVGGGSGTCELFDPIFNKWSLTGNNTVIGKDGVSLVMLADGRVLATEGHNAEIYDPVIGLWTVVQNQLIGDRVDHSSVLLSDGRVLLTGSVNFSDQKTSEIFNPADNSFTASTNMSNGRANSQAVLMDNGKVLAFGLGDFFNLTDTKLIEVYDPQSNTWSSNTYNKIGSQAYSIQKLGSGKFLVMGGSFTTGNGATNGCIIIDQGIAGCTSPNLSLSFSNSNSCWGKNGLLTITNSEAGVSYQGFIGNTPATSLVNGTGSSCSLSINKDFLTAGTNYFVIRITKPGCPSNASNSSGSIISTFSNITVTPNKTFLCFGDSALLDAPSGYTSYLWSNGSTNEDIYVKRRTSYSLQVTTTNGCKFLSLPITISGSPSSVNAGNDQSVCQSLAPFNLLGTPIGGTWSGTGVNTSGVFNPSAAGPGIYTLTYSYCNANDTKLITVTPSTSTGVTISISQGTNPSGTGANIIFFALGTNPGTNPQYRFKVNNVVLQSGPSYLFSSKALNNNDQIVCELTSSAACANPAAALSNTIIMQMGPSPKFVSSMPSRNSNSVSQNLNLAFLFNQAMKNSTASDSGIAVIGSFTGKTKGPYSGGGSSQVNFTPNTNYFAGEKVSVSVTKQTRSLSNIPPVFPYLYQFKIKPDPSPASFTVTRNTDVTTAPSLLYSSTFDPTSFCAADFNGDGFLDYAMSNYSQSRVTIYKNNHDYTFTKSVIPNIQSSGITSADYDNDGDMDLAIWNKVYFNDGGGNFPNSINFSGSTSWPSCFSSGDINGDGIPDLIYANKGGGGVVILTFKDGKFDYASYVSGFTGGTNPSGIALLDVDGDYDMDIAISDNTSSKVYIGKNDGNGSFYSWDVTEYYLGGNLTDIASADFDNDGDIDLACSAMSNNNVVIAFNNGTGTFTTTSAINVGNSPYGLNVEDYDGDGDIDIVTTNKTSNSLSVRLNNGNGVFSGTLEIDVLAPVTGLVSGDFDNDNDIDIITATELDNSNYAKPIDLFTLINRDLSITVSPLERNRYCPKSKLNVFFKSNGFYSAPNKFFAQLSDSSGSFVNPIVIGSCSKDTLVMCTIPSTVTSGSNYRIRVISTDPPSIVTDNGSDIEILDRCQEIVSVSPAPNSISSYPENEISILFKENLEAFSSNKIQIYSSFKGLISKDANVAGDNTPNLKFDFHNQLFSGDRIMVVVDSNLATNNGKPINNKKVYEFYVGATSSPVNFPTVERFPITQIWPWQFFMADMDNDNDLDLLSLTSRDYYTSWIDMTIKWNNGNGQFYAETIIPGSFPSTNTIMLGDYDNDGDMDYAQTSSYDDKLRVYVNNGIGSFTLLSSANAEKSTSLFNVGDIDGDGDIDLGLYSDGSLQGYYQIYFNNGHGTFEAGRKNMTPYKNISWKARQVGDLDNDGDFDLAIATKYTGVTEDSLYIALNDGWGNFRFKTPAIKYSGIPYSGDFDNDGDLDLACTAEDKNIINVLTNDGLGKFTQTSSINTSGGPSDIAMGDLDGDGDLDWVVSKPSTENISIFTNSGRNFSLYRNVSTYTDRAQVGDLNNDGRIDIAVLNPSLENGAFAILKNEATPITGFSIGVNDLQNSIIQLYPNPTNELVNLEIDNINANELNVFVDNGLGVRVLKKSYKNVNGHFRDSFNLSALSKGMYSITIISNNGVTTKEIIIY